MLSSATRMRRLCSCSRRMSAMLAGSMAITVVSAANKADVSHSGIAAGKPSTGTAK